MTSSYKCLFKLYNSIENGDIRSVQYLLRNNPLNINESIPCKGIGVLHLAVGIEPIHISKQCTEILLKHGADPNVCSEDGMTPLHIAAIWGRLDNMKLLIGCGGDPSRQDLEGHSAFDYAAREQQWEVYDYLHNVEDEQDNSLGSQCAYSLDLEKILVTTDQVVAEYGPVSEQQLKNVKEYRKTDMIREWCDKTTLVMNRLYPTILSETYLIDDESAPWGTSDNITLDHTALNNHYQSLLNETKTSYKSCFSKKLPPDNLCISGVRKLEETVASEKSDCSCQDKQSSCDPPKRCSVYENFSLPGSPMNIAHTNYNSKSCLKKSRSRCNVTCVSSDAMTGDNAQSLITNDSDDNDNNEMNNAMAIVQNRTNELLYNSSRSSEGSLPEGSYNLNSRRSSASSGINSNFSSRSVAIASVEEEYKYEDREEDVVLIEKRLLLSSVVLPVEEELHESNSLETTILSVASSLPTSVEYDNRTLRTELLRHGFKPGPIDQSTRTLYLKKLRSLKRHPIIVNTPQGKTYSVELEKSLRGDAWMKDLSAYIELENMARADFANPNKKWREGTAKTSFTYLLLDPRMTDNLPARASKQSQQESWVTFVNSIFYVGKGKRSRPYSHLYQALTLWKRDFTTSKDKKVQHILDIWTEKVGVVCLHIFQNVIPAEAYTYEAAMIDVLGVATLKNLKGGNYYGIAASWPLKERRMLGLYLLYKAMLIFLSEGERQLRPGDID